MDKFLVTQSYGIKIFSQSKNLCDEFSNLKCGVYVLRTSFGRFYVGKTINELHLRLSEHSRPRRNKLEQTPLFQELEKSGECELITFIPCKDSEECTKREKEAIKNLANHCYNSLKYHPKYNTYTRKQIINMFMLNRISI